VAPEVVDSSDPLPPSGHDCAASLEQKYESHDGTVRAEIVSLGTSFHLVSSLTNLVAADDGLSPDQVMPGDPEIRVRAPRARPRYRPSSRERNRRLRLANGRGPLVRSFPGSAKRRGRAVPRAVFVGFRDKPAPYRCSSASTARLPNSRSRYGKKAASFVSSPRPSRTSSIETVAESERPRRSEEPRRSRRRSIDRPRSRRRRSLGRGYALRPRGQRSRLVATDYALNISRARHAEGDRNSMNLCSRGVATRRGAVLDPGFFRCFDGEGRTPTRLLLQKSARVARSRHAAGTTSSYSKDGSRSTATATTLATNCGRHPTAIAAYRDGLPSRFATDRSNTGKEGATRHCQAPGGLVRALSSQGEALYIRTASGLFRWRPRRRGRCSLPSSAAQRLRSPPRTTERRSSGPTKGLWAISSDGVRTEQHQRGGAVGCFRRQNGRFVAQAPSHSCSAPFAGTLPSARNGARRPGSRNGRHVRSRRLHDRRARYSNPTEGRAAARTRSPRPALCSSSGLRMVSSRHPATTASLGFRSGPEPRQRPHRLRDSSVWLATVTASCRGRRAPYRTSTSAMAFLPR
jgi:hypothetical protein